jgi:hypothetical protein
VIVTVPLYVPAAKLAGLTDTVTCPGVAPDAGVALSHPLPVVIVTAVVKFTAVAGVAETEITWFAGVAPPLWYVNDSDVGVAETATGAVTVSVTGTVTVPVVAPADVIVTAPVYTPGVSEPLAVTVTVAGRVVEFAETTSQDTDEVAVNVDVPTPPLTESCPVAGVPPCTCVRVRDVGVTASAVDCVIVRLTGTSRAPLGKEEEEILTEVEYVLGRSPDGLITS